MIDFVSKRYWFFIASGAATVIGIIFMVMSGLPWGIDFTGGTTMTVEPVHAEFLKSKLDELNITEATVQSTGQNTFLIQTEKQLTEEQQTAITEALKGLGLALSFNTVSEGTEISVQAKPPITRSELASKLNELDHAEATIQEAEGNSFIVRIKEIKEGERGTIETALGTTGTIVSSLDSVSDPVAKEKARNAVIAVAVASVAMLIYIWWAFRKVPKPFRYGVCAVVALLHDVFLCLAFFTIFASPLNIEINLMFVTGILTVVGYSVNDTVVVFDRIRENLAKAPRTMRFENVVNNSLTETLTRCIITVLTTLIATAAVYLFVGEAIRSFLMVLLVGIALGAYSSIFIASMLLVVWEERAAKRASKGTA